MRNAHNPFDMTGKTFGRFKVLEKAGITKKKR